MAEASRSQTVPEGGATATRLPGAERLPVIGLLGGIASGKSVVAAMLCELGAGHLDADRAGHDVLRLPEVESAARDRWGEEIFGPDGHIDRARLGAKVFAPSPEGTAERRFLEELTHPRIGQLLIEQAVDYARDPDVRALVMDAPVMMEAGWEHVCDRLVYVDAPREVRLSRALKRGWSKEDFSAREEAQTSPDLKKARADVIIDNSGSLESTRAQVERFWRGFIG